MALLRVVSTRSLGVVVVSIGLIVAVAAPGGAAPSGSTGVIPPPAGSC